MLFLKIKQNFKINDKTIINITYIIMLIKIINNNL